MSEQRRDISKRNVGGDQNHSKRVAVGFGASNLSGQHHGHIDIAGQVSQPFRMPGVGESCEMERVLMGWSRDDGIDFASEGELNGGFNSVTGNAPGPEDAGAVLIPLATPEAPHSYSDLTTTGDRCNLIFGPNNRDLGID